MQVAVEDAVTMETVAQLEVQVLEALVLEDLVIQLLLAALVHQTLDQVEAELKIAMKMHLSVVVAEQA
jgi:hypothetical protein